MLGHRSGGSTQPLELVVIHGRGRQSQPDTPLPFRSGEPCDDLIHRQPIRIGQLFDGVSSVLGDPDRCRSAHTFQDVENECCSQGTPFLGAGHDTNCHGFWDLKAGLPEQGGAPDQTPRA
jgi:hypothetical protein